MPSTGRRSASHRARLQGLQEARVSSAARAAAARTREDAATRSASQARPKCRPTATPARCRLGPFA
eukprot:14992908-Alexandrium_andersonii.AAC.1